MSDYYTLAELKWVSVREFTSIPTGRFYRARNGKLKEETVGIEHVKTAGAGRMPLDTWYQHAFAAIRREGKAELFEQICNHVREHCAWLHTEIDVMQYAADCLSSGVYHHWADFSKEKRAVPTAMGTAPDQDRCVSASTASSIMPDIPAQCKKNFGGEADGGNEDSVPQPG